MDRGSTPSRKEKDGPTRTSADISVPRLRPAFPEHLITASLTLLLYFLLHPRPVRVLYPGHAPHCPVLYPDGRAPRGAASFSSVRSFHLDPVPPRGAELSARRGWKPTVSPTRGTCMLQRGTLFWSVHSYPPSWKPLQPRHAAARPTSAIATRWHAVPAATQRQCATPSILPVNSIGHNAALTSVIRCADGSAVLSVQTARAR